MMHQNVARIHLCARRAVQLLGLLLLVGLHPACYSSSGKTYMAPGAPGGGGVGTLFADGFLDLSAWTVSSSPAASAAANITYIPATVYYLDMTDTTRAGSVSVLSNMTFTSQALTFLAVLQYTATSGSTDTVSIQIVDNSGPPVVLAQAVVDAKAQTISFTVAGGAATAVAFPAATFETVTFTIDSGNMGSWHMGATNTTPAAFGSHTTALRFVSNYAVTPNTAPTFRVDNVLVSNP